MLNIFSWCFLWQQGQLWEQEMQTPFTYKKLSPIFHYLAVNVSNMIFSNIYFTKWYLCDFFSGSTLDSSLFARTRRSVSTQPSSSIAWRIDMRQLAAVHSIPRGWRSHFSSTQQPFRMETRFRPYPIRLRTFRHWKKNPIVLLVCILTCWT